VDTAFLLDFENTVESDDVVGLEDRCAGLHVRESVVEAGIFIVVLLEDDMPGQLHAVRNEGTDVCTELKNEDEGQWRGWTNSYCRRSVLVNKPSSSIWFTGTKVYPRKATPTARVARRLSIIMTSILWPRR
jgi:hypothetical protein